MSNLLEGIFSNKLMRDFAFKQVRELFKEKELDSIVLRLDDKGEITAQLITKQQLTENGTASNPESGR